MKNELSDIDRALLIFRNRVENLLIDEGARLLSEGAFLLDTPAGPLRVAVDGRWIICHFASPLGGYTATKHASDPHTGKWAARCPGTVEPLMSPLAIDDVAAMLDRVRDFKPTRGERLKIEQDLRDQRRHILRMYEVFAAIPDPDAPKPEGCKPPLGVLVAPVRNKTPAHKPAKPKTVKRTAAKDAKPKRRGRVAKR